MPNRLIHLSFLTAALFLLTACADDDIFITGCEPSGDIRVYCNMQTPEDIAALEDGRHLLLAHFGKMGEGEGSLALFDTETEQRTALFPLPEMGELETTEGWGDPDCPAPEVGKFSPHGTHLHRLDSGPLRYLVVNHGGRESIELFEVEGEGAATQLTWRGCVLPAADTFINDVVGLDNGELIYTRMFEEIGNLSMLKSLLGFSTGDLWRWSPQTGPRLLPGTRANQPNGIEISADNRYVFANMYITGEVWKLDAQTGAVVATAPIASADNSAWGSDGRLWIATHPDKFANVIACFENQDRTCGAAFEIVALDPETMDYDVVFAHRGPPMGVATVAVSQNGRIYMGSFAGDRMISIVDEFAASPGLSR